MQRVNRSRLWAAMLLLGLGLSTPGAAQVGTNAPPVVAGAKPVTIERIKVHAPSIEGSLEGDSADRDVVVILPPGYAAARHRRYPVVYALHGYSIGAEQWMTEIHVPQTVEGAFAQGTKPMILVLPDSKTVHNGSMYSRSVTTGDFETFIARDLVRYIDSHYRTVPTRESRGLAGHSMGGYGTTRIGMKYPDVFGAIYMLSPCCLSPRETFAVDPAVEAKLRALRSPGEAATLGWGERAQLASAAAWSPNPKAPPLYLDLPVKDGKVQPDVLARWTANAPLAMIDQYAGNLRRYRGIGLDVGDQDGLKDDAVKLHEALDRYGIAHRFAIYPGTHTSNVALRIQNQVLPFFSETLVFPGEKSGR